MDFYTQKFILLVSSGHHGHNTITIKALLKAWQFKFSSEVLFITSYTFQLRTSILKAHREEKPLTIVLQQCPMLYLLLHVIDLDCLIPAPSDHVSVIHGYRRQRGSVGMVCKIGDNCPGL